MDKGFLSLRHVNIRIGKTAVIDDISFDLKTGETLTVVGPSGCGKSTLLNILGGIIRWYGGEIRFENQLLGKAAISRGYVPQNLGLLPWKKVKDNIFLPREINKQIAVSEEETESIIATLGLSDLMNRYPSQLSGGQRQRVALARVFISHPDLLLMDEPFSALDTITAETTRNLFLQLWQKKRITTIFTTHNLSEAVQLGKYILLLTDRPAKVLRFIENPLFGNEKEKDETEIFRFERQLADWMRENQLSEITATTP